MRYFDKTFWKMFLGFVALVSVSLVLMAGMKIYQSNQMNMPDTSSLQAH